MDLFDQAQELEQRQRATALAAQAATMSGEGRATCLVCGEEIAPKRRAALPNATRCLECQQRLERYRKRRVR